MGGIRSPGAFRKTSDGDPPTSGGAFSVWTPNTTSIRTYRNQIPNQSVVSVEKAGAFVVAGSSNGGTWTAPMITMPESKQQVTFSARLNGVTGQTVSLTLQFTAPISVPGITSHSTGTEYPAGPVKFSGTGTRDCIVTLAAAGKTVTAPVFSSGLWFAPEIDVPVGTHAVTVSATKDGYTTPQTSTSRTSVNAVTAPVLTSPLAWNRGKSHALPERRRAVRLRPAAGLPWPVLWFTVP